VAKWVRLDGTVLNVGPGKTSSVVTWLAPRNDGFYGAVSTYDLRRSASPITEENFGQASQIATNAPQPPGNEECVTVLGTACSKAYFGLKLHYASGYVSPATTTSLQFLCGKSAPNIDCGNGFRASPVVDGPPADISLAVANGNPAVRSAMFRYVIPDTRVGEAVRLSVYDLSGREIRRLAAGPAMAGSNLVAWDLLDEHGSAVRAGMFWIRLRVGGTQRTRSLMVTP